MSLKEDLEILDPASEVQSAYDESARVIFSDSMLRPWTISRHSVAIALGCGLARAVGPFVSEFLETGSYDNVLRDVIIVLYLSSIDDDAVIAIDSRLNAKAVMKDAYAWAERNGLEYGSSGFVSGVQVLDKILKGVLASFFEVEASDGATEGKKKDTVQLGKSKSPVQQASQAERRPRKSFVQCLWRKLFSGKRSTTAISENTR